MNHSMACAYRLLVIGLSFLVIGCSEEKRFFTEQIDYIQPISRHQEDFKDDEFDASTIPRFDPDRVDSRQVHGWTVNLSNAPIRLDLDLLKPDTDEALLKSHSNYTDAVSSVESLGIPVLPSVHLIDGKAKQFDDGLYAALELYWFRPDVHGILSDLDWLQRLAKAVPEDSRAASYIAVGLEQAGIYITSTNETGLYEFRKRFESELTRTKPIGFYEWNESLKQCYRVGRYFQMDFELDNNDWMQPLVRAFHRDPDLLANYRRIIERWSRLHKAPTRLTVLDLVEHPQGAELVRLRRERKISSSSVSLFPTGSNREAEITRKLCSDGLPADADLLRELVKAIRSGDCNLQPAHNSGWFDYRVFALETLLEPKRSDEANHLCLMGNYKRRSLEIFQALISKRTEVHVSQFAFDANQCGIGRDEPQNQFSPQLRLEPAPTYYLRMARSYRFLSHVLRDILDETSFANLRGLTQNGFRPRPLTSEVKDLQRLFYGCYSLSAEDLGLPVKLTDEEQAEVNESRIHAEQWLKNFSQDPDLAVNRREIVPVAEDDQRRSIVNWATLGIRFVRLNAGFHSEAPPRVKTADLTEWIPLKADQLDEATYLLPVEDFASVTLDDSQVYTRTEFQKLCDGATTRDEIIKRLNP